MLLLFETIFKITVWLVNTIFSQIQYKIKSKKSRFIIETNIWAI